MLSSKLFLRVNRPRKRPFGGRKRRRKIGGSRDEEKFHSKSLLSSCGSKRLFVKHHRAIFTWLPSERVCAFTPWCGCWQPTRALAVASSLRQSFWEVCACGRAQRSECHRYVGVALGVPSSARAARHGAIYAASAPNPLAVGQRAHGCKPAGPPEHLQACCEQFRFNVFLFQTTVFQRNLLHSRGAEVSKDKA